MSLVVEDGSGKSDAETYVSLADVDIWHTNRNDTGWAGTDAVKEAAIRKAMDYLESRFTWATGTKGDEDQALAWPRDGAYDRHGNSIDSNEILQVLKDAVAYLALYVVETGDIAEAQDRPISRFKAGEVELTYEKLTEGGFIEKTFPFVNDLLKGLILEGSYTRTVVLT